MAGRSPALAALALLTAPAMLGAQGGVPQGPEFRVNTYTDQIQYSPSVASDSAGNFMVAWTSLHQEDGNAGVYAQRYQSSGAPLGGEFRINSYTTDYQAYASIASDAAGNFVVAWQSYGQDGAGYGIYAQRYASTGAPLGLEFPVNSYTTSFQRFPAVASDPRGNFVIVWDSQVQDPDRGIFAQRYASTGNPLGAEFRVNSHTIAYQITPSVAADPAGNFIVVWTSYLQDGADSGIFGQRYSTSGMPLGAEFRVNSFTTGYQKRPAVAADLSGNFVVVWDSENQDGSGYGVYAQRFASTGEPLGGEFRANSSTTDHQLVPAVTCEPAGNFIIAWQAVQALSSLDVFAQRYAADGTPVGGEFRVNTFTNTEQWTPSVSADPAGNFVVIWASNLEDASLLGVFGQRFAGIIPVELQSFRIE